MKKFLGLFIAVIMAITLSVGLVACGKSEEGDIKGESNITSGKWEDACDIENFEKDVKIVATFTETDTSEEDAGAAKLNVTVLLGEGTAYFTGSATLEGSYTESSEYSKAPKTCEFWMTWDGEDLGDEFIVKDGDSWVYSDESYYPYLFALQVVDLLDEFQYHFEDFEYSDKENGYVQTSSEGTFVVKIADGKVRSLKYSYVNPKGDWTEGMTFELTYGKQTIAVPVVEEA